MKGVSRNKFMLCCRPVVVDMDLRKRPVGRALDYIAAGDGKKLPAAESGNGSSADFQEPVPCPPKRTLSRVIRAVLFEVILSKSVRDKKGLRSSNRSNSLRREGSSSSSSYASDENKTEYLEDKETKPNSMEVLSSSVLESRNGSRHLRRKSNMDTKQSKNAAVKQSINSGVFLFLVSLAITVLWGKLWAIVFTSLWIYFLPLPSGVAGVRRPETVEGRLMKARSGGSYYKKRVIMEGLLERSNRRAERDGEIKA